MELHLQLENMLCLILIDGFLSNESNTVIKMKVANTRELLNYMNEGTIDFALVEGYFNKLRI